MSEHKHADLWNKLVDEAGEDEIDRAASVGVEQAEAELKAAGFDVGAERAKASAFLDALECPAPEQETPRAAKDKHGPQRPRSRPAFAWLAAAATVGVVAGGALQAALVSPAVVGQPSPRPPVDLAIAADLRAQAAAACDAKQWAVCLANLDKARAGDPAGDDEPAMKRLRGKAIAEIMKEPAGPKP
jgi:hypothetical protein